MSTKQTLASVSSHNQYRSSGLTDKDLLPDPLKLFSQWFKEASSLPEPEAVAVSTCSPKGVPSTRVVLLKEVDERGFVFYTNYDSRKGKELFPDGGDKGMYASMAFYWAPQHRSVRVVGRAEKLSKEETERYYHSRPVGSQIGAWASKQSSVIKSRDELDQQVKDLEQRFGVSSSQESTQRIPVPPFWGGVRIVPFEVEFWMGRESRLHDRFRYTRPEQQSTTSEQEAWQIDRLSP